MKILVLIAWLLGLGMLLATGAYLVTHEHPYIGAGVLGLILFLRLHVDEG